MRVVVMLEATRPVVGAADFGVAGTPARQAQDERLRDALLRPAPPPSPRRP
jgi:hypothetical protein